MSRPSIPMKGQPPDKFQETPGANRGAARPMLEPSAGGNSPMASLMSHMLQSVVHARSGSQPAMSVPHDVPGVVSFPTNAAMAAANAQQGRPNIPMQGTSSPAPKSKSRPTIPMKKQ